MNLHPAGKSRQAAESLLPHRHRRGTAWPGEARLVPVALPFYEAHKPGQPCLRRAPRPEHRPARGRGGVPPQGLVTAGGFF